jgi:tyrosinase
MKLNSLILQGSLLQAALALGPTFPITGVQAGVTASGARPFRQNINTFQNAGPAWDLYILALETFTQMDPQDLTSYFQIAGDTLCSHLASSSMLIGVAGIHGFPNIPWDGVSGSQAAAGFCTHNSILFPTWHRPYLALFEQSLWTIAQTIAPAYPESNRDQYVQAAQTLRIPYWDWSTDANVPAVASTPWLQVNTPVGQRTVANPLFTYHFGADSNNTSLFPGGTWFPNTVRHPDSSGATNTDATNAAMQQVASSLHTGVYQLFSNSIYAAFADQSWAPVGGHPGFSGIPSLEAFHGTVHVQVGGNGQMTDIALAAFDPVFWLHHCNIDRIFAIWEAINPNSYVTPYASGLGTWMHPSGTIEDINSPLYPFHSDAQGTTFTSQNAQGTRGFGYAYPEVVDWNKTPAQVTSDVTAIVNQIYNPTNAAVHRSRHGKPHTKLPGANFSDANKASHQWIISVMADPTHLKQALSIHYYLTTPPNSPAAWASDTTVVATQPIIIRPGNHTAGSQAISGHSFLTFPLLPLSDDLSPEAIIPLLKSKLQWRARFRDGSVVDPKAINASGAIQVTVASHTVEQTPADDALPIYGDWIVHGSWNLGANGAFIF